MARLRLGVALLLPSPVAEEVEGMRRALGDRSLGRVPPHLTLVPPVNVAEADLGRALAVLRAAAAGTPLSLTVVLGPPTSFLPANPVLYLPVEGGEAAVHALRQRVWEEPLTRALTWPFVPHVTLADEAPLSRIEAATVALCGYRAEVVFERVHLLVERRAGAEGPKWIPLADAAFGPPAVVARGGPLAVELVRSAQLDPEGVALLESEGAASVMPAARALWRRLVITARRECAVVGVGAAWLGVEGVERAVYVARGQRRQGIGRHLGAALGAAVADAGWGGSDNPRGDAGYSTHPGWPR
ncbi:MAG: 2'-5' RNA ligase family protein [Acidimicrobiales bacterium]